MKKSKWRGKSEYRDEYEFGQNKAQREEYGAIKDEYGWLREDQ